MLKDIKKEIEEMSSAVALRRGQIIDCKVSDIWEDKAIVNLGRKVEGIVPLSDFEKDIKVGDSFEAVFVGMDDGFAVLSAKEARRIRRLEKLKHCFKSSEPISGIILGKVKGGYEVDMGEGILAFLPSSYKADAMEGGEFTFIIKECRDDDFIVSRKLYIEKRRKEERERILKKLNVGEILDARVKKILDFYAICDIGGGITAKLLREDISWEVVEKCSDFLREGQGIKVKVLEVVNKDKLPSIRVGIKQIEPDPWISVPQKYSEGDTVSGTITSVKSFGAFVRVEKGLEAFLPASEISWHYESDISKILKKDDKVMAKIISLSPEKRKMVLSVKRLYINPYSLIKPKDEVRGVVKAKLKPGYEVEITASGQTLRAFLPNAEISYQAEDTKINEGDEFEFLVLKSEAEKKNIILSLKRMCKDPLLELLREIKGKRVTFVVSETSKSGIFGDFEHQNKKFKGFIHLRELVASPTDYPQGSDTDAIVLDLDKKTRVFLLSEKHAIVSDTNSEQKGIKIKDLLKKDTTISNSKNHTECEKSEG